MTTSAPRNIAQHWSMVERAFKEMAPHMSDRDLRAAQWVFHAGYCSAMSDLGHAGLAACGDHDRLAQLIETLTHECKRFVAV